MRKTASYFIILENNQLNYNNFLLVFQSSVPLEWIAPGQFVNLQVPYSATTFLRRPFSVFDVDYSKNTLSVLIKVIGEGTRALASRKPGEHVSALFPLGKGFTLPEKEEKILLVGGGVGIAPMMLMARESLKLGAEVSILLGARTKEDHILIEAFQQLGGSLYLTTDDGSLGTKGWISQHPVLQENKIFSRIHCCGPEPMMKAVARIAHLRNIDCEVSLENTMACGFGVCLCCVTPTHDGNRCVCTDGPVFNTNELKWQI